MLNFETKAFENFLFSILKVHLNINIEQREYLIFNFIFTRRKYWFFFLEHSVCIFNILLIDPTPAKFSRIILGKQPHFMSRY